MKIIQNKIPEYLNNLWTAVTFYPMKLTQKA